MRYRETPGYTINANVSLGLVLTVSRFLVRPEGELPGSFGGHSGGSQSKFLRRQPPQSSVRTALVVMASPALDDDLGFAQGVEDLAVEQLIAQAGIKAFNEAILPRAAGGDVRGLCADRG
jgi:hypothetical protein